MGPKLLLALSLFSACGIHASLLLVPRAAFLEQRSVPVIEIELGDESSGAPARGIVPHPADAHAAPPLPAPPAQPPASPITPGAAPAVVASVQEPAPQAPGTEAPEPGPQPLPAVSGQAAASSATGAAAGSGGGEQASGASGGGSGDRRTGAGPALISSPVLIPPTPRSSIQAIYPRGARQSGREGLVKISALVNERGVVTSAEVFLSSGSRLLDQAALEAVRAASFLPAQAGGRAVPCRLVIPIRFQLSQ